MLLEQPEKLTSLKNVESGLRQNSKSSDTLSTLLTTTVTSASQQNLAPHKNSALKRSHSQPQMKKQWSPISFLEERLNPSTKQNLRKIGSWLGKARLQVLWPLICVHV